MYEDYYHLIIYRIAQRIEALKENPDAKAIVDELLKLYDYAHSLRDGTSSE